MAILIKIVKIEEDANTVKYKFTKNADWQDSDHTGVILINKNDGSYKTIQDVGDDANPIVTRVIYKLLKHWEAREFPDETSWAS